MRAVLVSALHRANLPVSDATLLRLHSNAVFAIRDLELVVRVATNPNALPGATAAVRATRWLTAIGYPCTPPADVPGQPFVINGRVVTFWRLLAVTPQPRPIPGDLGRLLRTLHSLSAPPPSVPTFTDPLASVSAAVDRHPGAVSDRDREWLTGRIERLRAGWRAMNFPHRPCLIHGDAHDNNLMRTADARVLLGDWDHVAIGPREWDLAQLHYTHRRFSRPDEHGLDEFAEAYGWDIREWPGLDDVIAVREISGLGPYLRTAADRPATARELAHRLQTLRSSQTTAGWTPPTPA